MSIIQNDKRKNENQKMVSEKDINWKQTSHWSFVTRYVTTYRDQKLGIECHATVRRTKAGTDLGKASEEYFIDKNSKKFKSIQSLLKTVNEKHEK